VADVKNNAENLLYSTEKSLREMGDRVDAETRSGIENAGAELKKVMDGEDIAEIKAKTDALMQASHKLAEAVYQHAQQEHSQSSGDGQSSAQQDENVEEGDYEVIDEDEQK
jgi:molecular chaperone DnaK